MALPAIGLTRVSTIPGLRLAVLAVSLFVALLLASGPSLAQTEEETVASDQAVAVEPVARDDAIENRIGRILRATGWYRNLRIGVDEGIVFLDGIAGSEDQRIWARDLATRTEGTVAVVNRIAVLEEVNWDFAPAFGEIETLARKIAVALPLIVLAVLILPLAWWLSSLIASLVRRVLAGRVEQDFLRNVIARAIAIPILLLGIYLVLQVAGLTGLAVSLLGGAGVIGIVIGLAFRDIAENFLASLLLSIRRPFSQGDVIGVADFEGVVQTMNTRSTILLTLEGNHVQIPNATVFKSTIVNYTAGPARRITAEVGIGYDTSIGETQNLIVDVLRGHEAILHEPPPVVLVDALGSATVNLKAHFWIDGRTLSPQKVRSSALRRPDARRSARGDLPARPSGGGDGSIQTSHAVGDTGPGRRRDQGPARRDRIGLRVNLRRRRPRQRDRRPPPGHRRRDDPRSRGGEFAGTEVGRARGPSPQIVLFVER